jgi:hypothetical protein
MGLASDLNHVARDLLRACVLGNSAAQERCSTAYIAVYNNVVRWPLTMSLNSISRWNAIPLERPTEDSHKKVLHPSPLYDLVS